MFFICKGTYSSSLTHCFTARIFRHLLSISAWLIIPSFIAFLTSAIARGTSSVNSRRSFPAKTAILSTTPGSFPSVTPFIFIASVTISPLKPIRSLRIPVMIALDKVDGTPVESSAGISKCATITPPTPAFTSRLNGYISKLSNLSNG